MKLNPNKCAFGVRAGKFLGYMVTERGVEVNPEKVQAIVDMKPLRNIKEVQVLTGSIIALSRFIAQAAERAYPFFKILRKIANFNDLKKVLANLPLLPKPVKDEKLYVYLAVGPQSVSSVFLWEEKGKQIPIYYTSRVIEGAEDNYSEIEKLGLALVTAARKLRPYFLSHTIVVRTNNTLKATLVKIKASGRMLKWAVELGQKF